MELVAYDTNNCTDTLSNFVIVQAHPDLPKVAVSPDSVVCAGTDVVLHESSSFKKEWFVDNSPSGIFNDSFLVQHTSRSIHVIVENASGCKTASFPIQIIFKPIPPAPIVTALGNIFTSSSPSGNQWYSVSTGLLTGDTGVSYMASTPDIYYVKLTVNGCTSDSSNHITYPATSIDNTNKKFIQINVYPNPNKGSFTLSCQNCTNVNGFRLILTDNLGKQVFAQHVSEFNDVRIQTIGLSSGIYMLRVLSDIGISNIPIFIR